jgi:hypothetical protein
MECTRMNSEGSKVPTPGWSVVEVHLDAQGVLAINRMAVVAVVSAGGDELLAICANGTNRSMKGEFFDGTWVVVDAAGWPVTWQLDPNRLAPPTLDELVQYLREETLHARDKA